MLLSDKLGVVRHDQDKQVELKKILPSSTQNWAHINSVGEYDFSDVKDYKTFNIDALMELNLSDKN